MFYRFITKQCLHSYGCIVGQTTNLETTKIYTSFSLSSTYKYFFGLKNVTATKKMQNTQVSYTALFGVSRYILVST